MITHPVTAASCRDFSTGLKAWNTCHLPCTWVMTGWDSLPCLKPWPCEKGCWRGSSGDLLIGRAKKMGTETRRNVALALLGHQKFMLGASSRDVKVFCWGQGGTYLEDNCQTLTDMRPKTTFLHRNISLPCVRGELSSRVPHHRIRGEIVIAFTHFGRLTFGKNYTVPDCLYLRTLHMITTKLIC